MFIGKFATRSRLLLRFILVCIVGLLTIGSPVLHAQQNNSSISGVVTDPQGGVVPGATVMLQQPATGLTRTATTDERGYYKFPSLSPGSYDVSVKKEGFREQTSKGFTLLVSQDAAHNIALAVGSVSDVVTVDATAPLVDTNSAVVGQVIESEQIVTYPLNGRNFLQLATLSAGVTPLVSNASIATTITNRPNTTILVSGNRESATSFLLDGVEMRDDRTGALTYQVSLDALEEFKVQRSFFPAENGFHPAVVNIITKAGTNQFHFTGWEFIRNTMFNGRNYFATTVDPYHQHQYGLIFSGPILKDKLQFLFDYEALRYTIGVTSNGTYPDQRQLSGDFSESFNKVIYDPASPGGRTPFAGNIIPPGRINSVAQKAIALLFPTTTAVPVGPNFLGHPNQTEHDDQYLGRLDMPSVNTFGRNTQLMFRFAYLDSNQIRPGLAPLQGLTRPILARNAVFQATTTLSPTWVNVFRVGYHRSYTPISNIGANTRNISAEIGLTNTTLNAPDWAAPVLSFTGYSSLGALQSYNLETNQNTYMLADNLTWVKGKHTFKAGVDIRAVRNRFDTGTYAFGSLSYTGVFTSQLNGSSIVPNTGNPIADFLLGYPASGNGAGGSTLAHYHYQQAGVFIQDDWKVTPRLAIQAGVRYEPSTYPKPEEQNNYIFDKSTGYLLFPKLNQVPDGLISNPHREIGPRVGFSFSPDPQQRMTVRGGAGIYFDMTQTNELQFQNYGPPFYYIQSFTQPGNTISGVYQTGVNTFNPVAPAPMSTNYVPPAGTSFFSMDKDNKTPTIYQYNLNVQQQMTKNSVFEIGYFGSHGLHLSKRYNYNSCSSANDYLCIASRKPFPTYGYVFMSSTQAFMHYNSLQTRFEQRFNHGFTILANYMWQHILDNDSGTGAGTSTERAACLRCDYGTSEYNVRQRFVASMIEKLPIGRGHRLGGNMPRALDAIVGGWTVSGIVTLQEGQNITVTTTNNAGELQASTRPNCVSNQIYTPNRDLHNDPNHQWLNPAAFQATTAGTFGNCPRGVYIAPGTENVDASLSKFFPMPHKGTLELRAEAYNALNHTNFGIPSSGTSLTVPITFGRISSAGSARVFQFAAKIKF